MNYDATDLQMVADELTAWFTYRPGVKIEFAIPEGDRTRNTRHSNGRDGKVNMSATPTDGTEGEEARVLLAFTNPRNWRRAPGGALPTNRKRKVAEGKQCDSHAGKVRCHRVVGHTGRHSARATLVDERAGIGDGLEWVHEWRWDNRGRVEKDRWREQTLF